MCCCKIGEGGGHHLNSMRVKVYCLLQMSENMIV